MRHIHYFLEIEKDILAELVQQNKIVDISKGGLVVGNRHTDGGIKIIQEDLSTGRYGIVGEMEGGEFVINSFATSKYLKRIEEINDSINTTDGIDGEVPDIRQYIIPAGHFVIKSAYPQVIINRAATQKYLDELVEMNENGISAN